MNLTFISATLADIPALIAMEREQGDYKTYSPILEEEEWVEEMRTCTVFLLLLGKAAVGSVAFEQKAIDHLYLSGLLVRPAYRGRGFGRRALEYMFATHPAVRRYDLHTHPDNPALKLYESVGFRVEERLENFYGDGEPRVIMATTR
jgi:ribosomal protein S18 acetylase RimI-like enzyme